MEDKQIAIKPKNDIEVTRKRLGDLNTTLDPKHVLAKMKELLDDPKDGSGFTTDPKDIAFKAMTILELDNGTLLTVSVPEHYKTFGIELMKSFQAEYDCTSPSEKATAELASLSFLRMLDVQRRITNYLDIGTFTDIGVRYLQFLSKEQDRANRHYLSAIQTLRTLKQPPMQLNIRADTAIVGQNQMVQSNNESK